MCGRYASVVSAEQVRELFRTTNPTVNHPPSWNVAPSQAAMVVRQDAANGECRLDLLRWGLVPHFTTEPKAARKPVNARSETAASSPMFRDALGDRRCLVPADAFYEWRTMPDGKQPSAIAPLAFAGVWEGWRPPEGEVLRTFAILTTAANGVMSSLHERMPVVVEEDDWATWLGETGVDPVGLMRPAVEDVLHSWAVSRAVNNVRNDVHDRLDRLDDPHAPSPSDAPSGANPA